MASESAADEASVLTQNGPNALAECLVELGKRLAQPAPLDMSFAIAWPALTVARETLGVLNFNFK